MYESDERGGKTGSASSGAPMRPKRYGGRAQLDGWRMMVDGGWMDGCGVDERWGAVTVKIVCGFIIFSFILCRPSSHLNPVVPVRPSQPKRGGDGEGGREFGFAESLNAGGER